MSRFFELRLFILATGISPSYVPPYCCFRGFRFSMDIELTPVSLIEQCRWRGLGRVAVGATLYLYFFASRTPPAGA